MTTVRPPAVAGRFYPADADELRRQVKRFVASAGLPPLRPQAIIVPHAGYVYSGPIAGSGYASIENLRRIVRRVVLLGPAHFVGVAGLAASSAESFATPLGRVPLDREALGRLKGLPQVQICDAAHEPEHSLEVHLPFLQEVLDDFALVPLLVGDASGGQVSEVLDTLWDGPETLIVVSSDLSHFEDAVAARRHDAATARAIQELRSDAIQPRDACGCRAIGGLLESVRRRGLAVTLLDLRNSGDTGGGRDRVVGYGAFAVSAPTSTAAANDETAEPVPQLSEHDRWTLLDVARASILNGVEGGAELSLSPADYRPALQRPGAAFVTLRIEGLLRGCMGTLNACRSLVADVAYNAFAAANRDPRFEPLTTAEYRDVSIQVSVLGDPVPLQFTSQQDLLAQLRPGIDGLTLHAGGRRGTLLPAVWDHIPVPDKFLAQLKKKAGLEADYWSPDLRIERYTAECFAEPSAAQRESSVRNGL